MRPSQTIAINTTVAATKGRISVKTESENELATSAVVITGLPMPPVVTLEAPRSKRRAGLHGPGHAAAGNHGQRPAQQRRNVADHRCGDNGPGHDRGRRGHCVEQVVQPGHVVGHDLQNGGRGEDEQRRDRCRSTRSRMSDPGSRSARRCS